MNLYTQYAGLAMPGNGNAHAAIPRQHDVDNEFVRFHALVADQRGGAGVLFFLTVRAQTLCHAGKLGDAQ
ncbi:MAG: hypothetical protein IPG23_10005 [Burkholderiales bacterium]|nr:hypothetical protein [Burkholderiales bacterium]